MKHPTLLVVLDGWGLREEQEHNGVALAHTPNFDQLVKKYPFTTLEASGERVGLPSGQMGNSEVGHTTIGAGKVMYQDLVRITKDATSGAFAQNAGLSRAYAHVVERSSTLHIIGLFSSGGVHAHEDHFIETMRAAKKAGVKSVVLHPFLDGRDSPKTSGTESLKKLEAAVHSVDGCVIGSVIGRYYAMDRDTNWDRTDMAFQAIFNGRAEHIYEDTVKPSQLIQEWYHKEVFDEQMEPMVFMNAKGKVHEVRDGDAIIFTNFRSDRAKQLSSKITALAEDRDLCFVSMAHYGKEIHSIIAYTPEKITETLGSAISFSGLTQSRIAETEKYPHATYFMNGGRQEPYDGEEDVLIPSRKDVKTHDEAPEMRAKEICDAAIERLESKDFLFINFANPDMVGHTANQAAIITAIETVDDQLGRLVRAVVQVGGQIVIIADHGNAEVIVDPFTKLPHTAHTTNPVPCIIVTKHTLTLRKNGSLADVAPTVLALMNLSKPLSMTGDSLIAI